MEIYKSIRENDSVTYEIQKDELNKKEIDSVYKSVMGDINAQAQYNPNESKSFKIKANDPVIATELKEYFWKKTGVWRKGKISKSKIVFKDNRIKRESTGEYNFSIEV